MSETLESYFAKLGAAADEVGEPGLKELVRVVQSQSDTAKLNLLIIGSTGSGRFATANILLGTPQLLPVSPVPKSPISLKLTYGDGPAQVVSKVGIKTALSGDKLASFLSSPETEASRYQYIEVPNRADLLANTGIRIESLQAERSKDEWKQILAVTDYALVVLRATALLSEQERNFLKEVLVPNFGLERVAIVLNQLDLVDEDERPSLVERVRGYLGSFESQPVIIEFSANQARRGLASGDMSPNGGYEELTKLVRQDLAVRQSGLKIAALRQAIENILSGLENEAARQNALTSTSREKLQELSAKFDSQSGWLNGRIERAQKRVETYVNNLLKEQFFRDIEGFSDTLRQQLPNEIMAVSNVQTIKLHMPGYLEKLWTEFFERRVANIKNQLTTELKQIAEGVETDLREVLGKEADLEELLGKFNPTPSAMRSFIMPKRGESNKNTIATGLQLGGLFLMFASLPLGLGAIGLGQLIRTAYKKDLTEADKKALATSAVNATHDLEGHIKKQVEKQFEALTEQVRQTVTELYQSAITSIKTTLDESSTNHAGLEAKREKLTVVTEKTIPELRQELDALVGQPV